MPSVTTEKIHYGNFPRNTTTNEGLFDPSGVFACGGRQFSNYEIIKAWFEASGARVYLVDATDRTNSVNARNGNLTPSNFVLGVIVETPLS